MNRCYDQNGTLLGLGDAVMGVIGGRENEGVVAELLENNKIKMDGENGIIQVSADDVFVLP